MSEIPAQGFSRDVLLLWRLFEARVAWLRIQIPRESGKIFGARDGAPTADLPRRERRAVPPSQRSTSIGISSPLSWTANKVCI